MRRLYPDPEVADPSLDFSTYTDVIRHYTKNSLRADGLSFSEVRVFERQSEYVVHITGREYLRQYESFGQRHAKLFDADHAQKALEGERLLRELNVWNPMEGFYVNNSATDGTSKWAICPPLGLNVIGQRGILLMHYPPWAVIQAGTFDNAMTMQRWERLLKNVGIRDTDVAKYKTIVDINPIAAPGSGESEYPNDYFPIMMASGFFDGPPERDYIKSMLEAYLNPPGRENSRYTLPLLICGSPLYDPQAPGWFRTTYTDILPKKFVNAGDGKSHGIPQINVLQVGTFNVFPNSKKETPYMICNHMIAAGVTGRCTDDPAKIPDIRQYEAQDLVAASFLKLYHDHPNLEPEEIKTKACMRWYGNAEGTGAPEPPKASDRTVICALAQMDLFFVAHPNPHPKYTWEEATKRCQEADNPLSDPCAKGIAPPGGKSEE